MPNKALHDALSPVNLVIRNKKSLLCGAWFALHIGFVIVDGLNDDLNKADVGIVLGNKVETNGQPSNRLKSRLDKAVELYHQGYFKTISK